MGKRGWQILTHLILAGVLAVSALAVVPLPVSAASMTIDSFGDEYGPGGTSCSLREMIYDINHQWAFGGCPNGSGVNVIELKAGTYTLTIKGTDDDTKMGDLDITRSLTIRGLGSGDDGSIIDASALGDRVFHIIGSANVRLENLQIKGGNIASGNYGGGGILNYGGALTLQNVKMVNNKTGDFGGAVHNFYVKNLTAVSSLTVEDSIFVGNQAQYGGAIYSQGTLSISNSDFSGNTASVSGSGIDSRIGTATINSSTFSGTGSGIANSGTMTVNASVISNHTGNGITNGKSLTVIGSTIEGNSDKGIYNTANLTVQMSSIKGNSTGIYNASGNLKVSVAFSSITENKGVGLSNTGVIELKNSAVIRNEGNGLNTASGSQMTVINSTIGENAKVDPSATAGIDNAGQLALQNVTIANNGQAGLWLANGSTSTVQASILSGNSTYDCINQSSTGLASGSYNLVGNLSAPAVDQQCTAIASVGVNPRLETLADNGGQTLTYALSLAPKSPAIDLIPVADPACLTIDQRMYFRPAPAGQGCDAGAYEADSSVFALFIPFIIR